MLLLQPLYAQKAELPLFFTFDSAQFSATGRWFPADTKDKAAYPSEVEFDCERGLKLCTEAVAEYYSGHPHVSVNYLHVDKWDANGIIASTASSLCMTRNVTISFGDKTMIYTSSLKVMDKDKKEACKFFGASGTEIWKFAIRNSPEWLSDPYGQSSNKY